MLDDALVTHCTKRRAARECKMRTRATGKCTQRSRPARSQTPMRVGWGRTRKDRAAYVIAAMTAMSVPMALVTMTRPSVALFVWQRARFNLSRCFLVKKTQDVRRNLPRRASLSFFVLFSAARMSLAGLFPGRSFFFGATVGFCRCTLKGEGGRGSGLPLFFSSSARVSLSAVVRWGVKK